MSKVFLPLGLIVGAIAITSIAAPTLFSSPKTTLVQAQLNDADLAPMTQDTLEQLLREMADKVEVNQNQVLFTFENQTLLLVTDAQADRMRIIAPITKAEDITEEDMAKMMLANFHTALDGRYGISNGIVYAAFIHPLSSLQPNDFKSAVAQVTNLVTTFGSTYSSGNQLFGAPAENSDVTESLPAI